jgi:hypothetical protein
MSPGGAGGVIRFPGWIVLKTGAIGVGGNGDKKLS